MTAKLFPLAKYGIAILAYIFMTTLLSANHTDLSERAMIKRVDEVRQTPSHFQMIPPLTYNANQFPNEAISFLNLSDDYSFELKKEWKDEWGHEHFKFQQFYQDIPLEFCVLTLHQRDGLLHEITGDWAKDLVVNTKATLAESQALSMVLEHVGADTYSWEAAANCDSDHWVTEECGIPNGELVILEKERNYLLAYRFRIHAVEPHYTAEYYVDAQSGAILLENSHHHEIDVAGEASTKYYGDQNIICHETDDGYILREYGRAEELITYNLAESVIPSLAVNFTDTDTYWNNVNAAQDEVAGDAHWAMEMAYDYYDSYHDWQSYDGDNGVMKSFVHYGEGLNKAFWDPYGRIFLGDGDGNVFSPYAALDVIGHEFTHGVEDNSADLIYSHESGALSESFSDMFGTAVERFALGSHDWRIAADITINGQGIRAMDNPKIADHPDTYNGEFWVTEDTAVVGNDFGGVHTNCGVPNYWFYLLTEGGSGINDLNNSYTINPIGFDDAIDIAFYAFTNYLTPNSDFEDARYYTILAAINLYGDCSDEMINTINAWYAVGVGAEYTDQNIILTFDTYPTDFCEPGQSIQFFNSSQYASSFSWDFGDGTSSTSANPIHTYTNDDNFDISLIGNSCSGNNSQTLTKEGFISIEETNLCVYNMEGGSGNEEINECEGRLFDNGGGSGPYDNNSNSLFIINPPNATSVILNFDSFNLQENYDYLHIYDGIGTSATTIGSYTGHELPNGGSIESSGGSITLRLYSNSSINDMGFELQWYCIQAGCPPINPSLFTNSANNILCEGDAIMLTVDDNTSYESFAWSNSQDDESIIVTEPGTYDVTVTNEDGCTGTTSINISANYVNATVGPDTYICEGNQSTLQASGGTSYSWTPTTGLSNPNIANPIASPSSTQTYTVVVTNAYGCTDENSTTVYINENNFEVGINEPINVCAGTYTQLEASGGSSYSWTPTTGLSDPNIANPIVLLENTQEYTVTAIDEYGCTASANTIVNIVEELIVDISSTEVNICAGESINLIANGGLNYEWSPTIGIDDPNSPTPVFSPSSSQEYTVIASDFYGCTGTANVMVNVSIAAVSAGNDQTICYGESAQLNATGGFNYEWVPNEDLSALNIANPIVSPSNTTSYTVSVTDDMGCSDEGTVTITVLEELAITTNDGVEICAGESVALNVSGGDYYSWSPSEGMSNPNVANPTVAPSTTQTYTVIVSDQYACTKEAEVTVNVHEAPTVWMTNTAEELNLCAGESTTLNAVVESNSNELSYSWIPTEGLNDPNIANPIASPINSQNYTLSVHDEWGCNTQTSTYVEVNHLELSFASDVSICPNSSIQLNPQIQNNGSNLSYQWNPSENLDDPNSPTPTTTTNETQTYTLTVNDEWNCIATASITVFVLDELSISLEENINICYGESIALNPTADPSYNYEWTANDDISNLNSPNPSVSPANNESYSFVFSDATGCTGEATVNVTVNTPTQANAGSDTNICSGESVELMASEGQSFYWSPTDGLSDETIQNPIATPNSTQEYTVIITDENGCNSYDTVLVEVSTLEVIVSEDTNICNGETTQLNASGGQYYEWTPSIGLSDPNIANPIANPTSTQEYTVTISDDNGCAKQESVLIGIYNLETSVSENTSICNGESIQLDASGGQYYEWTPSIGLSDPTIPNPIANPASTQEYTVTISDDNGCTKQESVLVGVNDLETSVSEDTNICNGEATQLNASGGQYYEWIPSTGLSDPSIPNPIANPSSTQEYIVNISNDNGCAKQETILIGVYDLETSASEDMNICNGETVQLNASGGQYYEWTPSTGLSDPTIPNPIANPTNTQEYTVTISDDNGCTKQETILVEVNVMEISVSENTNICTGETLELNASGGQYYEWTPSTGLSDPTIANPIASPTSTQTYTVVISNDEGCNSQALVTVGVWEDLQIDLVESVEICEGESFILNATGANEYQWEADEALSATEIPNPTVSPLTTQTFTVTGQNVNGCSGSASIEVIVHPNPTIEILETFELCLGESVELSANEGGATYIWEPALQLSDPNIPNPIATPESNQTYSLTMTTDAGCFAVAEVFVEVHESNFEVSDNQSICAGESVTLQASGASVYTWSPNESLSDLNIANPIASPPINTTYEVLLTDENGCTKTESITIEVFEDAMGTENDLSICYGNEIQLNAFGGETYTWSPAEGLSNTNSPNPIAAPNETTLYTVLITDENGCSKESTQLVSVSDELVIYLEESINICEGESIELNANGGTEYQWDADESLSATDIPNPMVSPLENTTYHLIASDQNGCSGEAEITVLINENPVVTLADSIEICEGETIELNVSGGNTYEWVNNNFLSNTNIPNPMANPISNQLFEVNVISDANCITQDSIWVIVSDNNFANVTAESDIVCLGDSVQLFAVGGENYTWNDNGFINDINSPTPYIYPETNQTFVVSVTNDKGCTDTAMIPIEVSTLTTNAGIDKSICAGESVKLQAQGGQSFIWEPANLLDNNNISNPIATVEESTTFTVIATNEDGCTSTDEILINTEICCESEGSGTFEWIESVIFNGQLNQSGSNAGYALFDNLDLNFAKNTLIKIIAIPGYALSPYAQEWQAWIDYNNDGNFDDSEIIYQNIIMGNIALDLVLPPNTPTGTTKMRLLMRLPSDTPIDPCAPNPTGEVEDYIINIID